MQINKPQIEDIHPKPKCLAMIGARAQTHVSLLARGAENTPRIPSKSKGVPRTSRPLSLPANTSIRSSQCRINSNPISGEHLILGLDTDTKPRPALLRNVLLRFHSTSSCFKPTREFGSPFSHLLLSPSRRKGKDRCAPLVLPAHLAKCSAVSVVTQSATLNHSN